MTLLEKHWYWVSSKADDYKFVVQYEMEEFYHSGIETGCDVNDYHVICEVAPPCEAFTHGKLDFSKWYSVVCPTLGMDGVE